MSVKELKPWFAQNWQHVRAQLIEGSYQPQLVMGIEIPKPGGGMRQLGIQTVVDRLVQQAILQVLDPLLDPTFSEASFGFRPGRSAHQALDTRSKLRCLRLKQLKKRRGAITRFLISHGVRRSIEWFETQGLQSFTHKYLLLRGNETAVCDNARTVV